MTPHVMSEDSWNEWRLHLTREQDRMARNVEKIVDELQALKLAHNILQTKVIVWGSAAAAIVTITYQLIAKVLN